MTSVTGHGRVPVSVVVPCYRCSNTIERAVRSVLLQTAPPLEILLIDDCSGDGTIAKLNALRELAPDMIAVLTLSENGGPAHARNAGLAVAVQPYVAFLDADDSWHPAKLEIQYGWMCRNPDAGLTGHAVLVAEQPVSASRQLSYLHAGFLRVEPWTLLVSNRFSTPSVMLRKDLAVRFDSEKRYGEDYLLWLQICLSGVPCYFCNVPLAYLHKAHYGKAGLSNHLWRMELGELDGFRRLRDGGLIGSLTRFILVWWSFIKFVRRMLILCFRSSGKRSR